MIFERLLANFVRVKGDDAAVAVESLARALALDEVDAADGAAGLHNVLQATVAPPPFPIVKDFEG